MSEEVVTDNRNAYRKGLEKITPVYIIGFFSALEATLSLFFGEETVDPYMRLLGVIIIIAVVSILFYVNEIWNKNLLRFWKLVVTFSTSVIYLGLTLSSLVGIEVIHIFFQFIIAIWIVVLTPFVIDTETYPNFKIEKPGMASFHSCNPNSLDVKFQDGKGTSFHTYVFCKKKVIDKLEKEIGYKKASWVTIEGLTEEKKKEKKWKKWIDYHDIVKDRADESSEIFPNCLYRLYKPKFRGDIVKGAIHYKELENGNIVTYLGEIGQFMPSTARKWFAANNIDPLKKPKPKPKNDKNAKSSTEEVHLKKRRKFLLIHDHLNKF